MYSQEENNIFGIKEIENTTWYSLLTKGDRASLWAPSSYLEDKNPDDSNVLSLIRIIINKNNYLDKIGFVRFDFPKSTIIDLLNDATTIKNSSIYIQNSLGSIVAQSGQEIIGVNKVNNKLIKQLAEGTNHLLKIKLNNRELMVSAKLIDNTDWYLVSITDMGEIDNTSRRIRNYIIILVVVIGTIAYFIAYLTSKSITYRLSVLSNKMKDIHNGQLITIEAPSNSDEIDQLVQEYNFMVGEITNLINDKFKAGKEIKNAELKALQAQINPHFLYNTLDMINWYAWENDGPEIITIVESLAKFYKLSLSKGKDVVSIGDELTHVSYYFQIQSMRYKNALNLEISIDDNLMQYSILKITLQPIIENSILHGILCKETKSGNIRISGALIENDIHLYVEDDGVGMSEKKLESLLAPTSESSQSGGFGVRNIDHRIKLYYGIGYGLNYTSEKNQGTTVEITFPAVI
jgi:two-component system sensor histidine kinase YesM